MHVVGELLAVNQLLLGVARVTTGTLDEADQAIFGQSPAK